MAFAFSRAAPGCPSFSLLPCLYSDLPLGVSLFLPPMSVIKPAIIDRFIDLNQQISAWDFKRDGRLPQSLVDQSQLIRR